MAVTAKRPLVVKRIEISSFGLASEWHCFSGDRYPERFSRVYRKPTNSVGLLPRSSASKRGLSTPWHWPTPERPLVLHRTEMGPKVRFSSRPCPPPPGRDPARPRQTP